MKIYRIADISSSNDVIYVNKEDYDGNFWGHSWAIDVGITGTLHFVVNASSESEAFDELIDYLEKKMPEELIPIVKEPKLGDEDEERWIRGGNHGRYMATPIDEMQIKEINYTKLHKKQVNALKNKLGSFLADHFVTTANDIETALYWFSRNFSTEPNSELYNIFKTSKYVPGWKETVDSETELVKQMYGLLEDTFTLNGMLSIPSSVDEAIENNLTLSKLKNEALQACISRGHNMGVWDDHISPSGKGTSFNTCVKCGKEVMVDTNPPPNGIDIGGEAVALSCKPEYEMATPEELKRELGIG